MIYILKRISTLLLLASTAAAFAQTPPGEIPAAGADAGEQASPCMTDGETNPPGSEQGNGTPGAAPCGEQSPEAVSGAEQYPEEAPGEAVADVQAIEQEITGAEVSAEEEFEPDDEISEDYPVPLPVDI